MIDLSSVSYKSVMGKYLRFPLALIPQKVVLRILQGELRRMKWIKGSSTNDCWISIYELNKQKLFYNTIQPGNIVYDLGAHVGFYTLLAAKAVGKYGRVFSFEPLNRNLFFLKKHIALNQLQNVIVLPYAVGNEHVFKCFYVGKNRFSEGHLSDHGNLKVEVIRMDEFMAGQQYPLPDVIKMDMEGSEYEALLGTKKLLEIKSRLFFWLRMEKR
ncbi:FkbM family methyltransferase [Thermoflavifilum aggregans]|nr:FkbM family methyltransferase [Thermoflavifilum aggregans]